MTTYGPPNPICPFCRLEMECVKNGVVVENGSVQWRGDKFKCSGCQKTIIAAFGEGTEIVGAVKGETIHITNL